MLSQLDFWEMTAFFTIWIISGLVIVKVLRWGYSKTKQTDENFADYFMISLATSVLNMLFWAFVFVGA